MITLPISPAPNSMRPRYLDFGSVTEPPLGGETLRINRAGNRWAMQFTWPFMAPEEAEVFTSRLTSAQSQGVRIPVPLLGRVYAIPPGAVVNGNSQSGTTISVRGLGGGFAWSEGQWINFVDPQGRYHLHKTTSAGVANGTGIGSIAIEPPARFVMNDGAQVEMGAPVIEGLPQGSALDWEIPSIDGYTRVQVTIREVA